jgi:subtilisin family serine protease
MLYFKKIGIFITVIFLFSCSLSSQQKLGDRLIKKGIWNDKLVEYVDRQIAIKLKSGVQVQNVQHLLAQHKAVTIDSFDKLHWGLIELPEGVDIFSVISELNKNELIANIEPNFVYRAHFEPNDPYYLDGHQWALKNVGQSPPGGTNDADIDAPEAWSITRGNSNVIIAILDSGIPMLDSVLSHPDLNDVNKFILGPDYVDQNDTTLEYKEGVRDRCGHGTHIAGIISAQTNNQTGISGIAGDCKVMIIQVFDASGYGDPATFKNGVIYAVDNGAKIINYSGGGAESAQAEDAVKYACENGVVMSISAGNSCSGSVSFPAKYSSYGTDLGYINGYSNVIAVSATDHNDLFAEYSNKGPEVNVSAPGGFGDSQFCPSEGIYMYYDSNDIYSTTPNYPFTIQLIFDEVTQNYGYLAGTSMAAPHVAGIAGLILSVNSDLTPSEVRDIIQQTADDKGEPGRDDYYGYGRVNAYQAVLLALAHTNKSFSSQATAFNGQRKLYKSGNTLHEVFSSGSVDGGEIFYRRSTDNGANWDITKRLSDGTATSLAPCITMVNNESTVLVVWQQKNGTNYNIMLSHSTNSGNTWSITIPIQSNFTCTSQGPLPSVAGSYFNLVFVVYRTSSGLMYTYSNDMSSWTSPSVVPYTNTNCNSPSSAFYTILNPETDIDKCNLAYSTDDTYSSQVYYNYFDFNPYAWSTATNLSDILTGYAYHQKPSLAVSWDPDIVHVAWEASVAPHPTPVVVHRKGYSGNFGSQYYVISANTPGNPSITGLSSDDAWMVFQDSEVGGFYKIKHYNSGGSWIWGTPTFVSSDPYCNAQLSVGSGNPKYLWTSGSSTPFTINISTETLSKSNYAAFNYSRELNLIDSKTGAGITLEIQQPQIILDDGTTSLIPFTDVPPDSIIITAKEIFSYGNIQPFIPSADIDTVKLQYSVRMIRGENMLSKTAGTISFDIYDIQSGNPVTRISSQDIIADSDTTNDQYQINLPYKEVSSLINTKEIMIRPVIAGLKEESQEMTAGLGHIYRYDTKVESGSPKDLIVETAVPVEYHLGQNYPNPFNPTTVIRYQVPEDGLVSLRIYDVLGREIKELVNEFKAAGRYEVTFDASGLASGMYLCRLRADKYTSVKKMVLLR